MTGALSWNGHRHMVYLRGVTRPRSKTSGFVWRALALVMERRALSHGRLANKARITFSRLLRLLLYPGARTVAEECVAATPLDVGISLTRCPASNGLDSGAHGRGDPDGIRVVSTATLDAISRRKESVKALDKVRMSGEQLRDPVNNTRRVDAESILASMSLAGAAGTLFETRLIHTIDS
jgi:hypothetical protein